MTTENVEAKVIRGFCLAAKDHPTKVEVLEVSDGSLNIALITDREGMEPLQTGFRMTPTTFNLLTDALFRAAHDPTVWVNRPDA